MHPYALDLLRKMHFDITRFRSKSWSEFTGPTAPQLDFAFTLCDDAAAEVCPVWPGQPMTAHWGLPDPAAATGKEAEIRLAFADTFRMLNNRISIFVNLPINSLDKLSLQRRLDAIGKTKDCRQHARNSSRMNTAHWLFLKLPRGLSSRASAPFKSFVCNRTRVNAEFASPNRA